MYIPILKWDIMKTSVKILTATVILISISTLILFVYFFNSGIWTEEKFMLATYIGGSIISLIAIVSGLYIISQRDNPSEKYKEMYLNEDKNQK